MKCIVLTLIGLAVTLAGCLNTSFVARSGKYVSAEDFRQGIFVLGREFEGQAKKIITLIFQISDHPHQLGDYATPDESGREIQHLLLGDWHFSFWPDHAVQELRFAELPSSEGANQ